MFFFSSSNQTKFMYVQDNVYQNEKNICVRIQNEKS